MRIVGGALGGRLLAVPRDARTRPMLEKTRGAVFNILGEAVAGARILDLFAGTGALGLEALSRGAAFARFVERDAGSLAILRKNVEALSVGERCEIEAGAAAWALARCTAGEFGVAFLDPPYRDVEDPARRPASLALVEDCLRRVLVPGGWLVFHFPTGAVDAAALPAGLVEAPRAYGRNTIALFRRSA